MVDLMPSISHHACSSIIYTYTESGFMTGMGIGILISTFISLVIFALMLKYEWIVVTNYKW